MQVAISSDGNDLNAPVNPVFGRCPNYIFVDSDTMGFEATANPALSAPGGAGIQAAQMITNRGVQAVITGSMGPNAFNVLSSAGVQVYVTRGGTVRQAVEALKAGQLQLLSSSSAGVGRGMGRGMGGGWAGYGAGVPPRPQPSPAPPQAGLEDLKVQMKELQEQLGQVLDRIDNLEKG
ncbi:MAG: NifB/NifX family molybdenum-iron cluster-binding protein [Chloroflexota bacterium]|nr:NifB/NifX family molybdenum-iron cluster-binding protein [Chloroflexota bacterium]